MKNRRLSDITTVLVKKVLFVLTAVLMVVSILPVAAKAEDEYIYTSTSTSKMEISLHSPEGNSFVAYCFNARKGTPDAPTAARENKYKMDYYGATEEQFYSTLDPDSTHNNISQAQTDFSTVIKNLVFAGYPYKGVPEILEYAQGDFYSGVGLGIKEQYLDYKLRMATQYAIWYFTDDDYRNVVKFNRGQMDEKSLAGYMVEWVKKQTGLVSNIELDLFSPEPYFANKQNLLVTRVTEGGVPPVPRQETFGNLTLEKRFAGDVISGEDMAKITFTVTGPSGYKQTVSYANFTDGTYNLTGLVPGVYTVAEENADAENYSCVTEYSVENGAVEVKGNETAVLTIRNTYDEIAEVLFEKTDMGGVELEGAELRVVDENGNEVETWTSSADKAHSLRLLPGDYVLIEEVAPLGYGYAENIEFTVNPDDTVTVGDTLAENNMITMIDDYANGTVVISKTDVAGNEIEGAELVITDEEGNEVESWTSEEGKNHEVSLYPGTYTLTEKTAPEGYVIAESITFTVDNQNKVTIAGEEVGKVTMIDDYANGKVVISKTDVAGNEIEGAELVITDEEGNEVESWTSEEGKNHEVSLYPGTYTLTEKTAPEGYVIAESITFTVDNQNKVTIAGEEVGKVTMIDDYANGTVVISKTDVAGNEIEGAELVITDEEGNEVESWTSEEGKNHEVSLYPGTYTLTEKTAPEGYEVAESITFTVDNLNNVTRNGEDVDSIVMVDAYSTHTVKFSKQDILGEELAGASIELKDKDGNVIEAWVSDGTTKELEVLPGTYTFTETAAPEGYLIATDITIVVGIDGSVTSEDVTVMGDDENLIVMVDDLGPLEGVEPEQDIPYTLDETETPKTPEPEIEETPGTPETPKPTPTPTPSPKTPNTPKTGVATDRGAWGILAMSMGMFAGLFLIRRRYNQ